MKRKLHVVFRPGETMPRVLAGDEEVGGIRSIEYFAEATEDPKLHIVVDAATYSIDTETHITSTDYAEEEPSEPVRVAFVGKMASGKSTLADFVQAEYKAEKISFAGPIKEISSYTGYGYEIYDKLEWNARLLLSGGPRETDYELLAAKWLVDIKTPGLTPRELKQRVGTDSGRSIDKDIWIRDGLKKIKPGGAYVIDDVRFENEADALRQHGFAIVKLAADNLLRQDRLAVRDKLPYYRPLEENHASETELDRIVFDTKFNTKNPLPSTKNDLLRYIGECFG